MTIRGDLYLVKANISKCLLTELFSLRLFEIGRIPQISFHLICTHLSLIKVGNGSSYNLPI